MSSTYGPGLLKNPDVEDNVNEAVGRKKPFEKPGHEFETPHDRAKRIRKERRAQKERELEDSKKQQMAQAINSLLGGSDTAGKSGGTSVGSAGPSVGPAPASVMVASEGPAKDPAHTTTTRVAAVGPAPRPRGPMRPSPKDLPSPEKPETAPVVQGPALGTAGARIGHMDILAEQKRISWDELKNNLAHTSWREQGVPGSKEFDDYSRKLEKERTERLKAQEDGTKRLLKQINKGKGGNIKDKDKKNRGLKRTADDAGYSDDDSEGDDELLSRYRKV